MRLPAASKLTCVFSFHRDILFTSDVVRSLYSLSDILCSLCSTDLHAIFVQFFTHIARYITSLRYETHHIIRASSIKHRILLPKTTIYWTLPCQFHKACILKLDFGAIVLVFCFPRGKESSRCISLLSV